MARSTGWTIERSEQIVFGESRDQANWIYGAASCVPFLVVDVDDSFMIRFEAERLSRMRLAAIEAFEIAVELVGDKPIGFLTELEQVRHGITSVNEAARIAMPTAGKRTIGDHIHRDALWDAIDDDISEYTRERKTFRGEADAELQALEASARELIDNADYIVRESLVEDGSERSSLLREARHAYGEQLAMLRGQPVPLLSLRYAWLTFQLHGADDEAINTLEYALKSRQSVGRPGYGLVARYYAFLLARRGEFDAAHRWAGTACDLWPSPGTFHERASYAGAMGHPDALRKEVDAYIKKSRLALPYMFGDQHISTYGPDLIDVAVREQVRLRQAARRAVVDWNSVAKKVAEARRISDAIAVPSDLLEGAEAAGKTIETADFMVAAHLLRQARQAKANLSNLAVSTLQTERRRRIDSVDVAKRTIDGAWDRREQWIRTALARRQDAVARAQAVMAQAGVVGDRAQKGCAWGLGTGCAVFGLYIFLAGTLALRGFDLGITTPIGILSIVTAITPIGVSIVFQVANSIRRMILEAEVNMHIAAASAAYEQAEHLADEQYKSNVEKFKRHLTEEEAQLEKVENALRIVA